MPAAMTTSSFLRRLHSPDHPVLVFDGAMGTSLQDQNLTADDFGGADYEGCNEYLVETKPDAVSKVHREFLECGADVIETDTFGATSLVLDEYDLGDRAYELNLKAAQLAKALTTEFSTPDKPRFVAGSMGPTTKLPTLGHIGYDDMKATYVEQAEGLYDGDVDLFLVETCQDVLQIKAALNAIEEVFEKKGERRPLMVSVTMETTGTMLVGSDASAMLAILEPFPIDVLGLNCATGPDRMAEHIRYLSANSPFVISCIPNAGIPENVGGHAHYKLTPMELRMALMHFVEDLGVQVIGGCCGTRPDHIKQLAEAAQELTVKERPVRLPAWTEDLSDAAREALATWIDARISATEITLSLTCAECSASWSEALDIPSYFWFELEAAARGVLRDVADLAPAFSWSEASILALGPERRQAYLDLARAS